MMRMAIRIARMFGFSTDFTFKRHNDIVQKYNLTSKRIKYRIE